MDDKQCKQTEQELLKEAIIFLLLDGKPRQRYKVKINIIQGYEPYHIKKGRTFRQYY